MTKNDMSHQQNNGIHHLRISVYVCLTHDWTNTKLFVFTSRTELEWNNNIRIQLYFQAARSISDGSAINLIS